MRVLILLSLCGFLLLLLSGPGAPSTALSGLGFTRVAEASPLRAGRTGRAAPARSGNGLAFGAPSV